MASIDASSVPLGGSSDNTMARSIGAEYCTRTRSLPHPKYGPYACPRCEELFTTSQSFASHMRSHYRSESEEEKRMRLEEKHRGRGNRRGRVKAAAGAMAMAVRPVKVKRPRLKNLARNGASAVTESAELHEVEIELATEMDIKMEDV